MSKITKNNRSPSQKPPPIGQSKCTTFKKKPPDTKGLPVNFLFTVSSN